MISINIHLHPGDGDPTVTTIPTRDGKRFLVLDLGAACSISLPGYDAESASRLRPLKPGEVVILDLSLTASLTAADQVALRSARPIVVTGSADPHSRAMAEDLGATDYLIKPVELEDLAAAINRRTAAARP